MRDFVSGAYRLFAAGFVAHVIVKQVYSAAFRDGEIATAMVAFGIAVPGFVVAW